MGGEPIVVFATDDGIHAFENPGCDFEPADRRGDRFVADGADWDCATGRSDDGRKLEAIPARRLFAFAWRDDRGPDAFLDADG